MKEFCENTVLESEHLILRYLRPEDRSSIFRHINHDHEVLKYFIDSYREREEDFPFAEMIDRFRTTKKYAFAIVLKENNEVIGEIFQCSTPSPIEHNSEIGYALGREYWNRGYMSEALKTMIDFLFTEGVHKVTACHLEGNEASGRVMQKCGMVFEGIRKEDFYYHDRYWDSYNYYILNQ